MTNVRRECQNKKGQLSIEERKVEKSYKKELLDEWSKGGLQFRWMVEDSMAFRIDRLILHRASL